MKLRNFVFVCVFAVFLLGTGCQRQLASESFTAASLDKIRLSWTDDPETTMTIGWDQFGGENPKVYYGTKDRGRRWKRYESSQGPTRQVSHLNMDTRFCELKGLLAGTAYYFVIKDSEGVSERFWFRTAPGEPAAFTCIMGGDTKFAGAALAAGRFTNQMVAKLRPLFVLFCGDFTNDGINPEHWEQWLNDWFELTRTADGRLFPIVAVTGNHEYGDYSVLNKVFNAPYRFDDPERIYYSLSFGGDLVHISILNSAMRKFLAEQTEWLKEDLEKAKDITFKFAAYHKPFRPHTRGKGENISLYDAWAPLFYEYGVDISLDADSHVSRITYPVRPDPVNGVEGFVRDDEKGTMYIGEGSWGASPRPANDDKPWTLRSGSFNQVKWLQVFPASEKGPAHIDIRTVITSTRDDANQAVSHVEGVSALSENNIFDVPAGINLYSTEYGDVITYPFVENK